MADIIKRSFLFLLLVPIGLLLSGCQPKVYLMPSPVGLEPGSELFTLTKDLHDENLLYTLYVTNRTPLDNPPKNYSIFPSNTLRLGWAVHRVGEHGMSWEEILEESTKSERSEDLLISSEFTRETFSYPIDTRGEGLSAAGQGYFHEINTILDKTLDKDILVYVHGANCNFYRGTAQGAQFFHFTGHNSIVLTFSWPSAGNILRYQTDVLHASKTVSAFAKLIELLATHSRVRYINILAYSAGAQVVAPALASFRDIYPEETTESLKKRLRLGEVYFAAPDTAFKAFAERYLKFKDIVKRTTVNLNKNDSVLRISAMQNGVSRLGRPETSELDEREREIFLNAMNGSRFNILDVGDSAPLNLGSAHDSWYNHPWVSRDALILLMLGLDPVDRGLEEYWSKGVAKVYKFPDDYEQRQYRFSYENRAMIEELIKIMHDQYEK